MYDMERTKKTVVVMYCLSAVSVILSFIGLLCGGGELLEDGIMNNPGAAIMMFVFAGIAVLSFLTGVGFRALSKDIADNLKYFTNMK